MQYAGILNRFIALFIDAIILSVINFILFALGQTSELNLKFFVGSFLLANLTSLTYYALFESSPARATPGKMALGIAVTDRSGNQISLSQAMIRVFGKLFHVIIFLIAFIIGSIAQSQGDKSSLFVLSGLLFIVGLLIFLVGHLMAVFNPQKQALHDRIAKTFVIEFEDESRKFPQKVLLQLAALAIVSRLIFQLVPPTPIPWFASGSTNPTTTEISPSSTTETSPSPTTEPSPSPTTEPSNSGLQVITICEESVKIGVVNSDIDLQGKWEFQFSSSNVMHRALIQIKDTSGKMSTQFFDKELNETATVEQNIVLGTSDRGTWIVGYNPVNAENQQKRTTYAPDNFFLEISLDGSLKGYNCDDRGNKSPISIQKK